MAFAVCDNLTSVTFAVGSAITNFGDNAFPAQRQHVSNALRTAYLAGGAGTYTRASDGNAWTKQ